MEFSILLQSKIDEWQFAVDAENLGYDAAWFADSQMIWSDCYATMALAAYHTKKIRLGTGVSIPGTRIAPVTAHSIASINTLAPGRVFLGIGTGHTAMRVMGMKPMKVKDFDDYLRVLKALLSGDEVDYTREGTTRSIQFLHQDIEFINVDDPIPIYVAANGPKALAITGRYGDGLITLMGESQKVAQANMSAIRKGAEQNGRTIGDEFHNTALVSPIVMKAGETLKSDRVIDLAGAYAVCMLHYVYEVYQSSRSDDVVPDFMRGIWEEYTDYVDHMAMPEEKRYRQIHNGHATFCPPEERRFVTPEMIENTCYVGSAADIRAKVDEAESNGIKEISIVGSLEGYHEVMNDFAAII
ncbi:MAG: LLM class flavin-dependent oxidoreductase [Pseudomonadota bacterium]